MKRVIIDADPGIDDLAAISLALASPELSVEAITTIYGNGPVEACTANVFRILEAAGRLDIPVYRGAGKPLLREPNPGFASQVHGGDALGDITSAALDWEERLAGPQPAAVEIMQRIRAAPGEITVLALGRMTNVALALGLEPKLSGAVKEVVVMGGAVFVPGNVSPVATANLYEDPEAAAILYASGAPLTQVGLDVCDRVEFSGEQLARLTKAENPLTRMLMGATPFLQSYYRGRGLLARDDGVRYNDVPAVAYAIDPSLFTTQTFYVAVETKSEITRGQTVTDVRGSSGRAANVRVCLDVDAARLTEMFVDRLTGYGR